VFGIGGIALLLLLLGGALILGERRLSSLGGKYKGRYRF
jgi:Sec-independent protein translocase protein TatA